MTLPVSIMMCALAAQPDPAVLNVGTGGSVVVQAGGSLVVGGDGSNVEPKADWTGWNPETGPTNGRKLTVLVDNVKRVYELFKQADPSVVATPDFPSDWNEETFDPIVENVNKLFDVAEEKKFVDAPEQADWLGCCVLPPEGSASPSPSPPPPAEGSDPPSTFFKAATTAVDRLFKIASVAKGLSFFG